MTKVLPKGWKMFKFKDIGIHGSEKVAPGETDLDRYVGLTHLDSESLKIKRWGSPSDVIGEKLRVRLGEVIFGKRRAYQRKLAIAEFDCICSAHAMVLKANENNIRKDFFPFFLQSDLFMERALEISVGSLSPTINWGTLKNQEFAIPPLSEQKRIAEVLWAVEYSIWKTEDAIEAGAQYKRTLMKHLFMYGPVSINKSKQMKIKQTKMGGIPESWEVSKLSDICRIESGSTFSKKFQGKTDGKYPFYKVSDMNIEGNEVLMTISNNSVDLAEIKKMRAKIFPPGTIVFPKLGAALLTNKRRILTTDSAFDNNIMGLIPKKVNPDFLFYFMLTIDFSRYVQKGAVPSLKTSDVKNLNLPMPPEEEQIEISRILSNLDNLLNLHRANSQNLQCLKKELMQVLLIERGEV